MLIKWPKFIKQAVGLKAALPEHVTCAHLYLEPANSGYHFRSRVLL